MAAILTSALIGLKRASLEELQALHGRMSNLVESDKALETEMSKLAPDPASWDRLWQSQHDELTEKLARNDSDLLEEGTSEEESTSDEDVEESVEDEGAPRKKPRSLRAAMRKQLSLLDKEQMFRLRRIDYFEKFLEVEARRNELLTQKAELCEQIKDALVNELSSEEVLVPEEELTRRAMLKDMAKWWDCLLYTMSEELNQRMQDDEAGKWSDLYFRWCLWIDLKSGVYHDSDNEGCAQTNQV